MELDLSESTYIAGGSYGKVFRVRWHKKLTNLKTFEERPGDVAIKIVKFRRRDSEVARAKFFDEVSCQIPVIIPSRGPQVLPY